MPRRTRTKRRNTNRKVRRDTNRKVRRNTIRKVKRNTNRKVKRNTNRRVKRNKITWTGGAEHTANNYEELKNIQGLKGKNVEIVSSNQTESGVYKGVKPPRPSDYTYADIVLEVFYNDDTGKKYDSRVFLEYPLTIKVTQ